MRSPLFFAFLDLHQLRALVKAAALQRHVLSGKAMTYD